MTITLNPPGPIDFELLAPFEAESVVIAKSPDDEATIRRPGTIGAVALRPALVHDTRSDAESDNDSFGRLRRGVTVLRMDPAIARRRAEVARSNQPRNWSAIISVVGVAVATIALAMLFSPWMSVRTVIVEGAPPEVAKQIQSVIAPRKGTAMFRVPAGEIRRDVGALADIGSVSVTKQWPESLTVRVTVRKPFAVIRRNGGATELVDKTGHKLPSRAMNALPVIVLTNQPKGGQSASEAVAGAVAVLNSLDEPTLRSVQRVDNFGSDYVLRVGRTRILIGRADDLAAKAMLISSLHRTGRLPANGTIDVTIPDAVVLSS
jgi:cell division protein FtsQ